MSHPSDAKLSRLPIVAALLFWLLLFGLAAMRPGFSHLNDAVSELGSLGAPNMWVWNIGGYIVPGLLLAVFGWRFAKLATPGEPWAAMFLVLAGLGIVLAGAVPADMENRRGALTLIHMVGSTSSLLGWVAGLALIALRGFRRRVDLALASIAWLVGMVGAFALYAVLPATPGLVQRVCFAVMFGWYLVAGALLHRKARPATEAH